MTVLLAVLVAVCAVGVPGGVVVADRQGGASDDGGAGSVTAWVADESDGGVAPPAGVSHCERWRRATRAEMQDGSSFDSTVRVDEAGVFWHLYERDCGAVRQWVWIPTLSGRQLADAAADRVRRLLPVPSVITSPAPDQLVVGMETWFGVTPTPPVTASASIPGLSATVTATALRVEVAPGSLVPGEVERLTCPPWGSATGSAGGCNWTPRQPSVPRFTGTDDLRYHATVAVVWSVSWTATDGSSGVLADLSTVAPLQLAVREVQTIGGR